MRKFICVLTALLICASLALPVFAAEGDFVPSIEYKDGPTVNEGTLGDKDVTASVIVTTVNEAKNGTTDISEEDRKQLLDLYDELTSGNTSIPLDNDKTVLELVDISYGEEDDLGGNTLVVDLGVDIPKNTDVEVMVYVEGEWLKAKEITLEGDYITVELDNLGPVAIIVDKDFREDVPQTGDTVGSNIVLWISLLALSAVALVAVIILSKRKAR